MGNRHVLIFEHKIKVVDVDPKWQEKEDHKEPKLELEEPVAKVGPRMLYDYLHRVVSEKVQFVGFRDRLQ